MINVSPLVRVSCPTCPLHLSSFIYFFKFNLKFSPLPDKLPHTWDPLPFLASPTLLRSPYEASHLPCDLHVNSPPPRLRYFLMKTPFCPYPYCNPSTCGLKRKKIKRRKEIIRNIQKIHVKERKY